MTRETDPFGRAPERSLKDRLVSSKLGRRAVIGLVALGIGAGTHEGFKQMTKNDTGAKPELVDKGPPKDPTEDINANPNLPEQLQMGDQRVTLHGEKPKKPKEVRKVPPPVEGAPSSDKPGGPIHNPF